MLPNIFKKLVGWCHKTGSQKLVQLWLHSANLHHKTDEQNRMPIKRLQNPFAWQKCSNRTVTDFESNCMQ